MGSEPDDRVGGRVRSPSGTAPMRRPPRRPRSRRPAPWAARCWAWAGGARRSFPSRQS